MQADVGTEEMNEVVDGEASPLPPASPLEQVPMGVLAGAHTPGAGWEEQEEQTADVEFDEEDYEEDMQDDDDGTDGDEDETTEARVLEAMPMDRERGCQHYRRGCKLVGPCCGEVERLKSQCLNCSLSLSLSLSLSVCVCMCVCPERQKVSKVSASTSLSLFLSLSLYVCMCENVSKVSASTSLGVCV